MKAQVSTEFMSIAVVVLLFILVFFVSAFSRENLLQKTERQRNLDVLCSNIADKIDAAFYYGPGFTQNLTLPPKIFELSYTIIVGNKTVVCQVSSDLVSIENFVTDEVRNKTTTIPFQVERKTIKVENIANTIYISW